MIQCTAEPASSVMSSLRMKAGFLTNSEPFFCKSECCDVWSTWPKHHKHSCKVKSKSFLLSVDFVRSGLFNRQMAQTSTDANCSIAIVPLNCIVGLSEWFIDLKHEFLDLSITMTAGSTDTHDWVHKGHLSEAELLRSKDGAMFNNLQKS